MGQGIKEAYPRSLKPLFCVAFEDDLYPMIDRKSSTSLHR